MKCIDCMQLKTRIITPKNFQSSGFEDNLSLTKRIAGDCKTPALGDRARVYYCKKGRLSRSLYMTYHSIEAMKSKKDCQDEEFFEPTS